MTALPWVARMLWATVASVAMALGLSATVAAEPMGPCGNVTYIGMCEPISDRYTTPPRQSHPDAPVAPQGSTGLVG
jgi:hypothetical protein